MAELFFVVGMDHCGIFLTVFLGTQGFDSLLKGHLCAESRIFASSYAIGTHVSHTCSLLGCLLFWLSILASLGIAGREGMSEESVQERRYLLCRLVLVTEALWVCAHSLRLLGAISSTLLLFFRKKKLLKETL